MKKKNLFLIGLVGLVFAIGCSKDDEDNLLSKNLIGGEIFTPTEVIVKKYTDGYDFSFTEGEKTIGIATSDTIEGTYYFGSTTNDKLAALDYVYGEYEYAAMSGSIKLTKDSENKIQGIYSAVTKHYISGNIVDIENVTFIVDEPERVEDAEYCNNLSTDIGTCAADEVLICEHNDRTYYKYRGINYDSIYALASVCASSNSIKE